jgi:uroporphyrinogen decarboxylase
MAMGRRERCLTALSGRMPDRPPISFDTSPHNDSDNLALVYRYFGAEDKNGVYLSAGIDGFSVWERNAVMAEYRGPARRGGDGTALDFWGNAYPGHFGLYECDCADSLKKHDWPKIEQFKFSGIRKRAQEIQAADMVVAAGHIGLGYQMHNMLRGNEKALFDLTDPEYMNEYVERLTAFTCEYLEKLLISADGLIDVVRADEDMGTMDRLMISPQMWRRYYKPAWRRAFEIVHRYGAKVWMHSCGHIMPLMDDFIEIGVDCWNPFPPYVKGNDHNMLKIYRRGRLVLDGGISHLILIEGKAEDVRDETKRVLDTFAADGGLLVGPSQAITADMKTENIITMFETILN